MSRQCFFCKKTGNNVEPFKLLGGETSGEWGISGKWPDVCETDRKKILKERTIRQERHRTGVLKGFKEVDDEQGAVAE